MLRKSVEILPLINLFKQFPVAQRGRRVTVVFVEAEERKTFNMEVKKTFKIVFIL